MLAKALEGKPEDLDLKADWAHALVQSSPAPMQGVQVLLEIIRQQPKHLKAHSHLAKLAIESGQFPKAIARFKNLLKWYPGLGSAYLGLGEAYFRNGNKDSAVIYLQQYRGLVEDPETQQQIDNYLSQINP
jgi:predicted Zn-dependent protease